MGKKTPQSKALPIALLLFSSLTKQSIYTIEEAVIFLMN